MNVMDATPVTFSSAVSSSFSRFELETRSVGLDGGDGLSSARPISPFASAMVLMLRARRIPAPFPLGIEGTQAWLAAAAQAWGVDAQHVEAVCAPARERARAALVRHRAVLAGKRVTAELRVLDGIGKTRFVRVSARPVVERDQVTGVQGVVTDLTHQRETEEQLRVLEELGCGLAHGYLWSAPVSSEEITRAIM